MFLIIILFKEKKYFYTTNLSKYILHSDKHISNIYFSTFSFYIIVKKNLTLSFKSLFQRFFENEVLNRLKCNKLSINISYIGWGGITRKPVTHAECKLNYDT